MSESSFDANEVSMADQLMSMTPEQRLPILRDLIIGASGVSETVAQEIIDNLAVAGLSIEIKEEFERYKTAAERLTFFQNYANDLFPAQRD